MAEKALTAKQAQFVREYLIDLNATQAAIRAGYSPATANEQGARLLANVSVRSEVQKAKEARGEKTDITAARVLQEIARLAFFDTRKLLDADGNPVPIQELDDDTAAAIAGLEVSQSGAGDAKWTVKKYKVADKNSALEKLAKHLGIYEMDNKQKIDPLAEVLNRLGAVRSVLPVARD